MTDFFALLLFIGPMAAADALVSGVLIPAVLACGVFAITRWASPLRTTTFGALCLLTTTALVLPDLQTIVFGFIAYAIPFGLLVLPLIALLRMLKRFDLYLSKRDQGRSAS